MKAIRFACGVMLLFLSHSMLAQSISSPNGLLKMYFSLSPKGEPTYELFYKDKAVVKSSKLGLELKASDGEKMETSWDKEAGKGIAADFMTGFSLVDTKTATFDETWKPVWGEESVIHNRYHELAVTLKQQAQDRTLVLRFRLFDEGLGFRYEFPQQPNLNYFVIKEEHTQFAMAGDRSRIIKR